MTTSLIDRFRDRLPVGDATPMVSLGEGSTPLIRAPRLSERYGIDLWLKLESANPTGSFKDRGMTVAVSKAVEEGAQAVICASTGNTAASAAAYAARAGIPAVVLQPAGAVALGKLAQARAVGARVLEVRGTFDEALTAARELGRRGTYVLVNSVNPNRIEGQKTAAFEIAEELEGAPDALLLPYGGGGNTRALFRGFEELGLTPRLLPDAVRSAGGDRRVRHPDHRPRPRGRGRRGGRDVGRTRPHRHRRADPPRLEPPRARRRGSSASRRAPPVSRVSSWRSFRGVPAWCA